MPVVDVSKLKLITVKQGNYYMGEEHHCHSYYIKLPYGPTVYIHPYGFGNCQHYNIAWTDQILYYDNFKDVLKLIQDKIKKKAVVFDLSNMSLERILTIFPKEDILMNSKYTNTTGNEMNILIVKTDNLN